MPDPDQSALIAEPLANAILTIDLAAIRANYRLLQARAAGAQCAAVVKADAYGLGAAQVARALEDEGATQFFVAHIAEGVALRPHLRASARINVLHGTLEGTEDVLVAHDLTPVINTLGQLERWRRHAGLTGQILPTILQVDSGMSRFGLPPAELLGLADDPSRLDGLDLRLIMSHLACADDPQSPANDRQLAKFAQARAAFPRTPASLAASSGIFLGRDFHFDLVRPGAALYGIAPNATHTNPLQRTVRLQARVLQVRKISAGDAVGYGLTYRADTPRVIATIGAGYADGFMRAGAARGCAWFEGIRLAMLGRISMDSLSIDISDVPEGRIGEGTLVDLLGQSRDVDDMAASWGTIGYEVLTSLGRRYHRKYVNHQAR